MAEFRVLDTSKFANAANATKKLVEALESDLHITDKAIETLYDNWYGKGRDTFQNKYHVFERQADDIRQGLWDLYEAIIEAENGYMEQDLANAKKEAGKIKYD